MDDLVNVFICKDNKDIIMSMSEYEYTQRVRGLDTKSIRSRRTVTVGDGWITKFVSNPAYLDGMHIREITISERMSTCGDIEKLTNMINAARRGRIAARNIIEKTYLKK